MSQQYFSKNGEILPIDQAVVPIDDVAYSYGFGVYETLRVSNGIPYFIDQHAERLMASARAIELDHPFSAEFFINSVHELIEKNQISTGNIKALLVGGNTKDDTNLYIQSLNPLFPDRKLYKTGIHCITEQYTRMYPHAKTLNMLPSYLIYRKATRAHAYDALLVNQKGEVTEGTRTNFFAIKNKTIISPPAVDILEGVMRMAVKKVASEQGYEVVEQPILLESIRDFDGAFLTSTSTKIMPIQSIDDYRYEQISPRLTELMKSFSDFYKTCDGKL